MPPGFKVLDLKDIGYLDALLMEKGLPKPVPASLLAEIPNDDLLLWCVQKAVYQIPTIELLNWLAEKIKGKKAIEICSGKNGIGKFLGIRSTDSYMQLRPEISALYAQLKQTIVVPPEYVEKLDANEAVDKYQPDVVIGCFVTQKWKEGDVDGNIYGPDEEEIIKKTTYIHVGNESTHGKKRILSTPHESHKFSWLRSRAIEQDQNVIWVWN